MKKISRIGIDISRTVFQLHAVTFEGELVWRKRVYRSELCDVMRQIAPCDVGIEACGGAHYWGRVFQEMGHKVTLCSPRPGAGIQHDTDRYGMKSHAIAALRTSAPTDTRS